MYSVNDLLHKSLERNFELRCEVSELRALIRATDAELLAALKKIRVLDRLALSRDHGGTHSHEFTAAFERSGGQL